MCPRFCGNKYFLCLLAAALFLGTAFRVGAENPVLTVEKNDEFVVEVHSENGTMNDKLTLAYHGVARWNLVTNIYDGEPLEEVVKVSEDGAFSAVGGGSVNIPPDPGPAHYESWSYEAVQKTNVLTPAIDVDLGKAHPYIVDFQDRYVTVGGDYFKDAGPAGTIAWTFLIAAVVRDFTNVVRFEPGANNTSISHISTYDYGELYPGSSEYSGKATCQTVWIIGKLPPKLEITQVQTPNHINGQNTFIASDKITLTAQRTPTQGGTIVKWTVEGLGPAAGISGFPKDVACPTDAAGVSTFSFTPSDNPAFVQNRRTVWGSKGSENPNPPIAFEVTAVIDSESPPVKAKLSEAGLGDLEQDEVDTLRQEYFDYNVAFKVDRDIVVPSLGEDLNRGTYRVQVSVELQERRDAILAAYRSSTMILDGKPVPIPSDAPVVVGGFRNPQRNAIYSKYPQTSWHIRGRALDLSPRGFLVMVNGKRRMLTDAELHSQVYPALLKAAATRGAAITEAGAEVVKVGCCPCIQPVKGKDGQTVMKSLCEDHVHVDWR